MKYRTQAEVNKRALLTVGTIVLLTGGPLLTFFLLLEAIEWLKQI